MPDLDLSRASCRIRALCYTPSEAACIWAAVMPDGRLAVYQEALERKTGPREFAESVARQTKTPVLYTEGHPSLFVSDGMGRRLSTVFAVNGVALREGSNDPSTWGLVRSYMADRADGPLLVVSPACPKTVQALTFNFDQLDQAPLLADCIRLAVAGRPARESTEKFRRKETAEERFDRLDDEREERRQREADGYLGRAGY